MEAPRRCGGARRRRGGAGWGSAGAPGGPVRCLLLPQEGLREITGRRAEPRWRRSLSPQQRVALKGSREAQQRQTERPDFAYGWASCPAAHLLPAGGACCSGENGLPASHQPALHGHAATQGMKKCSDMHKAVNAAAGCPAATQGRAPPLAAAAAVPTMPGWPRTGVAPAWRHAQPRAASQTC